MPPVLTPEGELTRMVTRKRNAFSGLILLALACAGSASGQTWQAGVGLAVADVGLDENRPGLSLSVGRSLLFGDERFDFGFSGDYVQKAGVQPRLFTAPDNPLFRGDEKIRLHYMQPSLFLGLRRPVGPAVPRLYAGTSIALKVHEGWSRPVEDGLDRLTYEDTDFLVHLGTSLQVDHLSLDFRYSQGMVSQLIVEPINFPSLLKADDPLSGVDAAEDGAKISSWQLSVLWNF